MNPSVMSPKHDLIVEQATKDAYDQITKLSTLVSEGRRSKLDGYQAGVDCIVVLEAVFQRLRKANFPDHILSSVDDVILSLSDDIELLEDASANDEV